MNNTHPLLTTVAPLTSGDVAAHFGVTTTTVKRWAAAGLLEHFRTPGGHYRFTPASVARLKMSQHSPAPSTDVA